MLIPRIYITIITDTREFDSAFDRAIWLRDNEVIANRKIKFNYVSSCVIEQSFESLTQKCSIVLPRDLKFTLRPITKGVGESENYPDYLRGAETNDILTAGSVVVVDMELWQSQDGVFESFGKKQRYKGYLTKLQPEDNLTLYCEDDAWLLKQEKLTVSYPKGEVHAMVKDMCKNILAPENIKGGTLGNSSEAKFIASGYRLKRNPTIFQAIEGLRKNFYMRAWFKDRKLYVGKLWYEEDAEEKFAEMEANDTPARFRFQSNIIASKLQYKKKEDYKKGVELEVIDSSDNSRFKVYAGDETGDMDRIPAVDLTKKDAQDVADEHLKKVWYDGFTGHFKANIEPYLEHGWYVDLVDPRFKGERDGRYVIEKIVISYSPKGAWQDIYLNSKINA